MDNQRRQRILVKIAHTKKASVLARFGFGSAGAMKKAIDNSKTVSKFIGNKKVAPNTPFPYTDDQLRKVMSPEEYARFKRGGEQAGINTNYDPLRAAGWGDRITGNAYNREEVIKKRTKNLGIPNTEQDLNDYLIKRRRAQQESVLNMRKAMAKATQGKLDKRVLL